MALNPLLDMLQQFLETQCLVVLAVSIKTNSRATPVVVQVAEVEAGRSTGEEDIKQGQASKRLRRRVVKIDSDNDSNMEPQAPLVGRVTTLSCTSS